MFGLSRNEIATVRKRYPEGTKVRLVHMEDAQAPPAGTQGTVQFVDDAGQIHVSWSNGSSLAVLLDAGDRISVVAPKGK